MAFLIRTSRTYVTRSAVNQQRWYAIRATVDGPMPRDPALREGSVSYPFSVEYQRVKAYNQLVQDMPTIAQNPVLWDHAKKIIEKKTIPNLEARLKQVKAAESKLASDDIAGKLALVKEKRRIAATVAAILRLDASHYVNEHGIRSLVAKPEEVTKRYETVEADAIKAIEQLDENAAQAILKSF